MRRNEVRFCKRQKIKVKDKRFLCLLIFPHQACRGKLEDKEIFCFPHKAYAWVMREIRDLHSLSEQ